MTEFERVRFLGKVYARLRGVECSKLRPGHRWWQPLAKLARLLEEKGWLKYWRSYLVAQFHYAPDREKVYVTMLYGERAQQKFLWYLAKKTRRMGRVDKRELQSESEMNANRVRGHFGQSAWCLESFERRGFTAEQAFSAFAHNFHPLFVVMHPDVWEKLKRGEYKGRDGIQRAFKALCSGSADVVLQRIQKLRGLYDNARREQAQRWDTYNFRASGHPEH